MDPLKDTRDFADQFPIRKELAFFNHAAVAPITAAAAEALRQYTEDASLRGGVDSRWYPDILAIREKAARLMNARGGHEIAFVPNTSTGLALVARGIDWRPGDNVVTTSVEYPANRYPWEDLERLGVELIEVPQHPDGRIDEEDICECITNHTRVVSLSHVQFASGYRTQLREISDMVHHAGGYLCVDAIQSLGVLPVDVQAMGIDFLAADGHKWLLGPEGAGLFYCHEELCELLHPAVVGWMNMVEAMDFANYRFEFQKDARRFEPGSWNVPGMLALGASLDVLLEAGVEETIWPRVEALTQRLADGLAAKGYKVFSPRRQPEERSGIIIFEPGRDKPKASKIVEDLKAKGIIIVLRNGRLRASPHFYNTAEQVDRLLDALP